MSTDTEAAQDPAVQAIQALVGTLPPARAKRVAVIAGALRGLVDAEGDDGRIAFALVGASLAAEA